MVVIQGTHIQLIAIETGILLQQNPFILKGQNIAF